jgi:signal peptidase I
MGDNVGGGVRTKVRQGCLQAGTLVALLAISLAAAACSYTTVGVGATTASVPAGDLTFTVPSPSMEPTLQIGDRILVETSNLSPSAIQPGSIVVFMHPAYFPCNAGPDDNIQDLVKRVIGTPGESIASVANTIYINGKALSEAGWYRAGYPEVGPTQIAKQVIPKGDYFVMGDNRTDSCDSRTFGPISTSLIVGKVVAITWRNGQPYSKSL